MAGSVPKGEGPECSALINCMMNEKARLDCGRPYPSMDDFGSRTNRESGRYSGFAPLMGARRIPHTIWQGSAVRP